MKDSYRRRRNQQMVFRKTLNRLVKPITISTASRYPPAMVIADSTAFGVQYFVHMKSDNKSHGACANAVRSPPKRSHGLTSQGTPIRGTYFSNAAPTTSSGNPATSATISSLLRCRVKCICPSSSQIVREAVKAKPESDDSAKAFVPEAARQSWKDVNELHLALPVTSPVRDIT